ncbi:hypothetical protein CMUS01_13427 [Colletotrichum musicola]|uniref:Uncharacterized protein n=1 Tax=Colletotrichum musicola TaxID=2175873 RepID=A0A8H6JCR8_9PEZI|nr:hypothetical protein CMUS01_13427 [Colletotrichum musicola]
MPQHDDDLGEQSRQLEQLVLDAAEEWASVREPLEQKQDDPPADDELEQAEDELDLAESHEAEEGADLRVPEQDDFPGDQFGQAERQMLSEEAEATTKQKNRRRASVRYSGTSRSSQTNTS